MPWQAWATLAVVVVMVAVMARQWAAPDVTLLSSLIGLVTIGVLPLERAITGFANRGMLTVAALFIVAEGVHATGGLDRALRGVLGRPRTLRGAQARLMLPVAAASAFFNNTPLVAMMVPVVSDWSRRIGLSRSKLLIPLSYAAIMGGTCTLIGTSTNLIVFGLLREHAPDAHVGMFDLGVLGVPCLIAGTAYVLAAAPRWLPDRQAGAHASERAREYMLTVMVGEDSPVAGQSIERAGLRHLPGLFLVEIQREDHVIPAPGPTTTLSALDRLVFTGAVDSVVDLRRIAGLEAEPVEPHPPARPHPDRCLLEAVVSTHSSLAGRGVRELGFRTRYGASILAVHRDGSHMPGRVGDIVLRSGDVLLLEAAPGFARRRDLDDCFALVAAVEGSGVPRHDKALVALGLLAAFVVVISFELLPVLQAAWLTAVAMLLTGCLRASGARRALDLRVLLTIAAAFGVGSALEVSGAATAFGAWLVEASEPLGPVGLLAAIYLATTALTELITNNAAAALMFPLVVAAAEGGGMPLVPVALVTMMAASQSFATPIGYQTNLMVYGPGGYRFGDFLRFGVPLQIVLGVVTVGVAALVWL